MLKPILTRVFVFFVLSSFLSICLPAQETGQGGMQLRSQDTDDLGGFPDLYEASIAELQAGLQKRAFTSVDLVKVRFTSIYPEEEVD